MDINNYYRNGGHLEVFNNIGHCSDSCTVTISENNQMIGAAEEHSIGNQILLPEEEIEESNEVSENEYETENIHMEYEMQNSRTLFDSDSAELSCMGIECCSYEEMDLTNTEDDEFAELGNTVDIYLSVLEQDLATLNLSYKDKFWITESTLRAIPFHNNDVRKWSAEEVVFYLDKFSIISSPINYLSYHDKQINFFERFINQDINGESFLILTLSDLLEILKPPRRRQILITYGAILILRKYTSIYFRDCVETSGSDSTGVENLTVGHDIPHINSEIYFPILKQELGKLNLSNKDIFWITESALGAMPMFGTTDVRRWSVREVISYLNELNKISSPINYSNNFDPEKTNTFGKFINEDINGAAFLMLTQSDLLKLIKAPRRRQVLIVFGAILILKKYTTIFFKDEIA